MECDGLNVVISKETKYEWMSQAFSEMSRDNKCRLWDRCIKCGGVKVICHVRQPLLVERVMLIEGVS